MTARSEPVPADELRSFAACMPTGVTVVTTRDADGALLGLTMNAVTSLSLGPPLFLICVDHGSATRRALRHSGVFAINVLAHDQEQLSRLFASKGPDKLVGVGYALGRLGVPLLDGALAVAECRVQEVFRGGDHDIVTGLVEWTQVRAGEPLLFHGGAYARLRR